MDSPDEPQPAMFHTTTVTIQIPPAIEKPLHAHIALTRPDIGTDCPAAARINH